MVFATRFPVTLFWGPEFALVYNEAYVPLIGDKHPSALGAPARQVFPEVWDLIGPMMRSARAGAPTWVEDEHVPLRRRGFLEECYFTFSYSPVRNEHGDVEGVMDIAAETTEQVISRRRLQLLTAVTERSANADDLEDLVRAVLPLLRSSDEDLPAVDIRRPEVDIDVDYRLPAVPSDGGGPVLGERVERHDDGDIAWLPLVDDDIEHSPLLVVRLSRQLSPDDAYLGFLRLLAGTLGQAVADIRVRHAEREAAQVQRTMTEAFQRSLLPQPVGPGGPQLAMRYQPAVELAELGGDWYDWFEAPDGSLMLVIGDVAGHDQDAAATMGQVRNILRGVAFTAETPTPTAVLRGVDRALTGSASGTLATALLARVTKPASGTGLHVAWSSAGHPPPARIGPDGHAELLSTEPDLLLGVHHDAGRQDHELHLETGATLVLYTDGLIESRKASIETGMTRLVDALGQTHRLDVEEISDLLMTMAAAPEDDIALMVLRA